MAVVDLHVHTTASDGRRSPAEIVHFLARRGLKHAAITDHDSTDGLAEALQAKEQFSHLTLIPGIELNTDIPGSEIHILGYFIQWEDPSFQNILVEFRRGRVDRARNMVKRLAGMGIELEWERVLGYAHGGAVGRPHLALAMADMGYVKAPQEAFDRYIGRNGPAYVERGELTPVEAIAIIQNVGGVAVLAHPSRVDNLEEHLVQMKEAGLAGMEVYYGNYPQELVRHLEGIARRFELIPSGGSDFHATGAEYEVLPGDMGPPQKTVGELQAQSVG